MPDRNPQPHLDEYANGFFVRLGVHLLQGHGLDEGELRDRGMVELIDRHAALHPLPPYCLVTPDGREIELPELGEAVRAYAEWRRITEATEGGWVPGTHRYPSGLTDADRHEAAAASDRAGRQLNSRMVCLIPTECDQMSAASVYNSPSPTGPVPAADHGGRS